MPISFTCTSCQKPFKVSRKLAGKKIRCKGCDGVTRIPELPSANHVVATAAPAPPRSTAKPVPVAKPVTKPAREASRATDDFIEIQSEWVVECDDCGRKHKPDEKLIGKRIRCKCGSVLHLTEHPNAGIPLAPLEPEQADLTALQPYSTQGGLAPVYQAPPPSFQKEPTSLREQRKRDAEAMVRAADDEQQWRSTLKDEDDDDADFGPAAKIIGGVLMFAGGALWAWLAYQEGYVYGASIWLMGAGALSIVVGLIESIG